MERGRDREEGGEDRVRERFLSACQRRGPCEATPAPGPRPWAAMACGRDGRAPWTAGGGRRGAMCRPLETQGRALRVWPRHYIPLKNLERRPGFTDNKQSETLTRSSQHPKWKAHSALIFLLEKQPEIGETFTGALTDFNHVLTAQNPNSYA